MSYEFLTHMIKPWDQLNDLLSKPYAFQPNVNDLILHAANLAIAIRHQAEKSDIDEKQASAECPAYEIIIDVADAWKHGNLRKPTRNNRLSLASHFEFNEENQFRFIRNVVKVEHASKGSHDLLLLQGEAIHYWMQKLCIPVKWVPAIREATATFSAEAALFFNPKYQVHMNLVTIQFVTRNPDGSYVAAYPEGYRFAVYELPAGEIQ